jgi:hypothetical protein
VNSIVHTVEVTNVEVVKNSPGTILCLRCNMDGLLMAHWLGFGVFFSPIVSSYSLW